MKTLKILFVVALFYSCGAPKEESPANIFDSNNQLVLDGSLDENMKIKAFLTIDGDEVYGKYFYTKNGNDLRLKGSLLRDTLILEEFNIQNKQTGYWQVNMNSDSIYSGIWSNGSKEFKLTLKKSTENYYQSKGEEGYNKITNEAFQVFLDKQVNFDTPIEAFGSMYENLQAIDSSTIVKYLSEDYYPGPDGGEYFYGFYYYQPDYIGVVYGYEYFPGAFGVYNTLMVLTTFDYDGNKIDSHDIGGNYNDSNMGGAEVYSTGMSPKISPESIFINEINIYEENDDNMEPISSTRTRTESSSEFLISKSGKILEKIKLEEIFLNLPSNHFGENEAKRKELLNTKNDFTAVSGVEDPKNGSYLFEFGEEVYYNYVKIYAMNDPSYFIVIDQNSFDNCSNADEIRLYKMEGDLAEKTHFNNDFNVLDFWASADLAWLEGNRDISAYFRIFTNYEKGKLKMGITLPESYCFDPEEYTLTIVDWDGEERPLFDVLKEFYDIRRIDYYEAEWNDEIKSLKFTEVEN